MKGTLLNKVYTSVHNSNNCQAVLPLILDPAMRPMVRMLSHCKPSREEATSYGKAVVCEKDMPKASCMLNDSNPTSVMRYSDYDPLKRMESGARKVAKSGH